MGHDMYGTGGQQPPGSGPQYPYNPAGGPGGPSYGSFPTGPSGGMPPPPGGPGGPQFGYQPYGPPPPPPRSGRGLIIGLSAVVVVLAVVAVIAVVVVFRAEEPELVVLEPVGQSQANDFFGNLDPLGDSLAQGVSVTYPGYPQVASGSGTLLAGGLASGSDPGLYGGTQDDSSCDVEQLVAFLTDPANADRAGAWAGALGVPVDGIADYVDTLTSARLRYDTRVTNHGFSDGQATPFQSLLQAGTAVLVDEQGMPRVKCNCGNPLTEPVQQEGLASDDAWNLAEGAQNPDAAWSGLDPAGAVRVQPAPVDGAFLVIDIESGTVFERPAGTNGEEDALVPYGSIDELCAAIPESPSCMELGTGDVQVTLQWGSSADLDLHVFEPDGTEIYFGDRGPTSTGGQLDVDSNVGCNANGSVENVYWPAGQAPAGDYTVEVDGFSVDGCGGGDYTLIIRVAGRDDIIETGSVGEDETDTYDFTG
ncbi:DUF6777 domain-containing protein [Allonocardiopsis opalescens]|uniref:DUF6777 domain-containing protein n=1 Tax=Allonocardiopsis opalescens TaxID=1144618 RepID=A0A2T0QEA7_9ACTN|nr:DUF6777 domain-containing protein [Allonocardiopsis opalescens]PRY02284.1 hypothetical protein CLV72_101886 [Allonocardiopsis opalescens]